MSVVSEVKLLNGAHVKTNQYDVDLENDIVYDIKAYYQLMLFGMLKMTKNNIGCCLSRSYEDYKSLI